MPAVSCSLSLWERVGVRADAPLTVRESWVTDAVGDDDQSGAIEFRRHPAAEPGAGVESWDYVGAWVRVLVWVSGFGW